MVVRLLLYCYYRRYTRIRTFTHFWRTPAPKQTVARDTAARPHGPLIFTIKPTSNSDNIVYVTGK